MRYNVQRMSLVKCMSYHCCCCQFLVTLHFSHIINIVDVLIATFLGL